MANKTFYYVLVFTDTGATYVTSVDNATKTARWNKEEKPLKFSKTYAQDLAFGLTLNGNYSVVTLSPFEVETQPYNYNMYECKFERKEDTK